MANALPVWLEPGVEPPESLKTSGWQPGMKPSAQHMNWLFNRSYMVLKELQENGGIADLQEQVDTLETKVTEHLEDKANPHGVTTEQIGAVTVQDFSTHLEDKANPHGVTAEQVGAVTVQDFYAHLDEKATLLTSGHTQLSNATDSDDETKAATPKAVKTAYDRADAAFQSANNGKTAIANAVTAKGISASPTDTFALLATKIGQITTGKRIANGTTYPNVSYFTVNGLAFKARIVLILMRYNSHAFWASTDGTLPHNGGLGGGFTFNTVLVANDNGFTLTITGGALGTANEYRWLAIE